MHASGTVSCQNKFNFLAHHDYIYYGEIRPNMHDELRLREVITYDATNR